jgi:hypothetical protein
MIYMLGTRMEDEVLRLEMIEGSTSKWRKHKEVES